jgi:hypothetical protein
VIGDATGDVSGSLCHTKEVIELDPDLLHLFLRSGSASSISFLGVLMLARSCRS